MSVLKTASSLLQQLNDEELVVVAKAKELTNEVNQMNTELLGQMKLIDAVAQNFEEYAILKEFRSSKMNFKLEKIKVLKSKMNKSFGF